MSRTRLITMISISLLLPLLLLVNMMSHNRYSNYLFTERDCELQIPAGFKIVYSEDKKMYAIQNPDRPWEYLFRNKGVDWLSISIAGPDLFYDTCSAKGFIKEYLDRRKVTEFK